MGLRIKSNVDSLIAQNNLATTNQEVESSLEKLGSGYRINKSSDDPAGIAISDSMQAKMRSFSQAKRNASDGVSYLQIAEGGLNELGNIVIRMRELTTQAASETLSEQDRSYLNKEFKELGKEVIRIQDQTEFNGKKILKAENNDDINIQVGVNFKNPKENGDPSLSKINLKYENLSDFEDSIQNIKDLSIEGESGSDLGGNNPEDIFNALDDSMKQINDVRSHFGSLQSRLNHTITSIDVANENLSAAQSRIRDVDFAEESSRLAKNRILAAAGTSVLSQANQFPEQALVLLRQ